MGDLFDGYGSTLAPRKTVSGVPAFDEMFEHPVRAGEAAPSRAAYRELYQALAQLTQEELRGRTESARSVVVRSETAGVVAATPAISGVNAPSSGTSPENGGSSPAPTPSCAPRNGSPTGSTRPGPRCISKPRATKHFRRMRAAELQRRWRSRQA